MKEYSWLERAKKLVEYNSEALDFLRRVGGQLPVARADAAAISRLWVQADNMDETICRLLEEMNAGLLDGAGELDTTRGASMRQSDIYEEAVYYDCTWSLLWGNGRGILVNLAVESLFHDFDMRVQSLLASSSQPVRYPFTEDEFKEYLVNAYFAEATQEGVDTQPEHSSGDSAESLN